VIRSLAFADLDARTAYDVWRLRQDVFVVEQASPFTDLDGRDLDPTTRHLLLTEDGELAGYLRLLDDGECARIGRVVVARGRRGHGLADRLLRAALAETGSQVVRLDAQTSLEGWYASYGFEVSGPEFDDAGVLHLPMHRGGPGSPASPGRR